MHEKNIIENEKAMNFTTEKKNEIYTCYFTAASSDSMKSLHLMQSALIYCKRAFQSIVND